MITAPRTAHIAHSYVVFLNTEHTTRPAKKSHHQPLAHLSRRVLREAHRSSQPRNKWRGSTKAASGKRSRFKNMGYPGDVTHANNPLRGFGHTCSDFLIWEWWTSYVFRISRSFRSLCLHLAQPYVFPSLLTCYKVPICSWMCMLDAKAYHPSPLIPSCFGLAIISVPAYRSIIYAIGSCNELKDLAEDTYLFFSWSLYLIKSSWHFPASNFYFRYTSEQSIPRVISVSFWELRADFLCFLFYYI